MSKPFTWSYSALAMYENCPRQYHEIRIKKAWPDEKGEAALWGDKVHKALESRLKYQTPLPTWGTAWEPLCAQLDGLAGLQVEHKIAINDRFQPVDYFAKDVWARAIADVAILGPRTIVTIDWKTGKYRPDTTQLRMSAAMQLSHFKHLERATIQYQYLAEKKTATETITKAQVVEVWRDLLPRVERMQNDYASGKFTPKTSGLCRAHCAVMSCEYNGRAK